MSTQIPLYRAKKIDRDEYVIGSYIYGEDGKHYISSGKFKLRTSSGASLVLTEIDSSTLSIHFPDMIASDSDRLLPNGEKDLCIFASLSEDGKGGDTIFHKGDFCLESKNDLIAIYQNGSFRMTPPDFCTSFKLIEWIGFTTKITGIKQ